MTSIQFAQAEDGVAIAYSSIGSGPPMILTHNFGLSHIEQEWNVPSLAAFYSALASHHRVTRLDPRTSGSSTTDLMPEMTTEAMCRDLVAVADAAGADRFVLLAVNTMGPVAIDFAVRHPDRLTHLILCDPDVTVATSRHARAIKAQAALAGAEASELIANIWTAVSPADEHDAVISLVAAATGDTQHAAIADAIILWDAVELLVGVRVPTLVIVGRDSTNVSIEQIRQIATTIPGTAVHTIPSKFAPYFGGRDEALAAIGRFLGWRQTTPDSGPSHFRTVVFIDIVGSTEVLSHLGDEAGRTATRTIETTIGAVADSHAGSIVKHLGDGTLLEFPSASEALAFAAVVQHRLSDSALSVRVGMAAGEPIRENGDLHGAVVVQASRVADLAGAGEVLAADSVRQLVIGKEFAFETLGPKTLKGFEESVVVWRLIY